MTYKHLLFLFFILPYASFAEEKKKVANKDALFLRENFNTKTSSLNKSLHFKKITSVFVNFKKDSTTNSSLENLNQSILNKTTSTEQKFKTLRAENEKIKSIAKKQKLILFFTIGTFIIIVFFLFLFYFKNRKLKLELDNCKKIIASKRYFLENLSHEIKTPITVIIGYLSLIKQNSFDIEKLRTYIDLSIENSKKIASPLNNYLTLIKLSNTQNEISYQNTLKEIGPFFSNIIKSFSSNAALKNIKIYYKTNIKKDIKLTLAYNNLHIILNTLLSNAIKYSNTDSAIFIEICIENTTLIIRVKDEGIGIPEKEINAVFSRFYKTRENNGASGFSIGLSLVKSLVKLLKGSIEVESKENIGSVFSVKIPLDIINYKFITDANAKEFTQIKPPSTFREETIEVSKNLPKALIIDDNFEMVKYLKELLSHKLNCTFCFSGKEGLKKVRNEQFSLIISDFKMPLLNGLNFKKELLKIKGYSEIPFLLITATSYEKILQKGFTLGITDYISKPFETNEIIARIQNILENKKHQLKSLNSKEPLEIKGHFSELINKVHQTVLDNLKNTEFNVQDLASECCYSPKQLGRILQTKTGLTPVKIILEIRLLKAYELLSNKTYVTIGEVISEVGLTNRTYFSKKFYDRFGIKPIQLLKTQ
ncbi:MAG: signal transduction histidine kinase/DNA-binding response OmpR family regulator [Polaribacter sp.]|jgi:signal transduction histidine kinase/DNA-binding response OmpR family regulator